jgi:hypothetical protein
MKLQNNWSRFGAVLERTGLQPIVEESTKDDFWGARPKDDGTLVGMNVLGRLLMELRDHFRAVESGRTDSLRFPVISHFLLFGRPLEATPIKNETPGQIQTSLFK